MDHCCGMMTRFLSDVRINIFYDDIFREYYTKLRGGTAIQLFFFCPWCGSRLPRSVRDVYYGMIWDEYGDDFDVRKGPVPERFNKSSWWNDIDGDIEELIDKYSS